MTSTATQRPSPASIDLLEGRHEIGTLKGTKPRQSSWLTDGSYGLHWNFNAETQVEYSFSLDLDDATRQARSTVWLSKSCGSVDFTVKAQGNAIRSELAKFTTDPQYTYEVRAELIFTVDDTQADPNEVFTFIAVPENPSNCGLYWGMFYPPRP